MIFDILATKDGSTTPMDIRYFSYEILKQSNGMVRTLMRRYLPTTTQTAGSIPKNVKMLRNKYGDISKIADWRNKVIVVFTNDSIYLRMCSLIKAYILMTNMKYMYKCSGQSVAWYNILNSNHTWSHNTTWRGWEHS